MAKILKYLPELDGEEQLYVATKLKELSEEQAEYFANVYRAKRKDPVVVLLTSLLAFVGVGGVNRFYLGEIGMGVLYLLTAGLCLVGTLVDVFSHQRLTSRYNVSQADSIAELVLAALPASDEPPQLGESKEG